MNKYVARGLWTVLITGGFLALGAGVAHADPGTTGEDGIASGTQGVLGLGLPVQLGGNAISVLGDASSSGSSTSGASTGGTAPSGSTSGASTGSGIPLLGGTLLGGTPLGDALLGDTSLGGDLGGTLSGTQVLGGAGAPVTLGGNAVSVLGNASSSGAGTASGSPAASGQEGSTSGANGVLGGSQLGADLGVPVTLGGNAISVFGDASSAGSATGGSGGGTDPDPGEDPGAGPNDPGSGGPGTQPAALTVAALADTGGDIGFAALAAAALALAAAGTLVRRLVPSRR